MKRFAVGFTISLLAFFCACTRHMICPAFQSAFIYDEEALRKKFSYFINDSIPKKLTADKTKHLIITSKSYQRRMKSMQTVEMEKIYPVLDSLQADSLGNTFSPDFLQPQDSSLLADSVLDVPDSLAQDSTLLMAKRGNNYYEITLAKEKYNTDQDNYMWYLRDILILPDVRIAQLPASNSPEKKADTVRRKKRKKSFLKNLFHKKDKSDSTIIKPSKSDTTELLQPSPD